MQYIKKISLLAAVALSVPTVTHAANITDLKSLIVFVQEILNSLVPLLFALALVGFIWGVVKYIYAADPKKVGEARTYMIFSIIAMAVMLSVWGLALLLKNTFFSGAQEPFSPGTSTYTGTNPYTNYNNGQGFYTE